MACSIALLHACILSTIEFILDTIIYNKTKYISGYYELIIVEGIIVSPLLSTFDSIYYELTMFHVLTSFKLK